MVERLLTAGFIDSPPVANLASASEVTSPRYQMGEGKSGILRFGRNEAGELTFGNAKFTDYRKGISFYYDHDFLKDVFQWHQMEDSYVPYRGSIAFHSAEGAGIRYGAFYYDASGALRTIRGGFLTHNQFERYVPSAAFQKREDGLWDVYRFPEMDVPDPKILLNGEKMKPQEKRLREGQEYVVDEIVTRITEDNGRLEFHQQTVVGNKWKTIEVPSHIDIAAWRAAFDAPDNGFLGVLSEFPSSIGLQGVGVVPDTI